MVMGIDADGSTLDCRSMWFNHHLPLSYQLQESNMAGKYGDDCPIVPSKPCLDIIIVDYMHGHIFD